MDKPRTQGFSDPRSLADLAQLDLPESHKGICKTGGGIPMAINWGLDVRLRQSNGRGEGVRHRYMASSPGPALSVCRCIPQPKYPPRPDPRPHSHLGPLLPVRCRPSPCSPGPASYTDLTSLSAAWHSSWPNISGFLPKQVALPLLSLCNA